MKPTSFHTLLTVANLALVSVLIMPFICIGLCKREFANQAGLSRHQNGCEVYQTSQALKIERRRAVLHIALSICASDTVSNVTQGRIIPRLVSTFQAIDELVDENDRRHALEIDGGSDLAEHTIDENRTFRGYQLLVQHIAPLEEKLTVLDVSDLGIYIRELRKGASGARGDDAANLKPVVVSWLTDFLQNPGVPLSLSNKSERGFEHDSTGKLLCPMEYNWNDESVRNRIREGHPDFIVTADSWPAFLYPHGLANEDQVDGGLFKSAILVKAFKFLFTSPTSAEDVRSQEDVEDQSSRPLKRTKNRKAPTRGNVANLLGMRSVTPRAIAYVAVQLRFSLSSATSWNENDGCFSYPVFFNNVVDFFEHTPGPMAQAEVRALLSWWTLKVFGSHRLPSKGQFRVAGSSVHKLAIQRAARESANQPGA